MKIKASFAILALLGHISAINVQKSFDQMDRDDFFTNAQTSAEAEDNKKEILSAQREAELKQFQEDTKRMQSETEQYIKNKEESDAYYTKVTGFNPSRFQVVDSLVQLQNKYESDDEADLVAAKRVLANREADKRIQKEEEANKKEIENLEKQHKKHIKDLGYEPLNLNIITSSFKPHVKKAEYVQLNDEDDDRIKELAEANTINEMTKAKEDAKEDLAKVDFFEKKRADAELKYERITGHNLSHFDIIENVQLKDEDATPDEISRNSAVLEIKQSLKDAEHKKVLDKMLAEDKAQTMPDGLIHRPNGVLLDAKNKKIVNGANNNVSFNVKKEKDAGPALIQGDSRAYIPHYATILDSNEKFDTRSWAEKEDFQKEIQNERKRN